MKTFNVHFTSDVWESIKIEANSEKEAEDLFHQGKWGDEAPEEHGKENLKVDTVEEIDPTTDRPIKKDK
tara:strand:+ start:160 stop:366 length:207 start_codon:yes stop_codon:yes gene_type:complete